MPRSHGIRLLLLPLHLLLPAPPGLRGPRATVLLQLVGHAGGRGTREPHGRVKAYARGAGGGGGWWGKGKGSRGVGEGGGLGGQGVRELLLLPLLLLLRLLGHLVRGHPMDGKVVHGKGRLPRHGRRAGEHGICR